MSGSERRDRPLLGIALMLAFSTISSGADAFAKSMTPFYPVPELIWIRYTVQTLVLLALSPWLGWRRLTVTRAPLWQIARGLALLLSASLFVAGLSRLPFATTSVLAFTSPLVVAAISPWILGEPIGLKRAAMIVLGFLGVVVIVRPGLQSVDLAMLFPLGVGMTYALYQVLTRYVSAVDPPEASLFYMCLTGCAVASLVGPFFWVTPAPGHFALLLAHGVVVGFSHFILIRAFALAPASLLAPFGYLSIVWASLLGYLFFDERLDAWTILGALMITLAGIYLFTSARAKP